LWATGWNSGDLFRYDSKAKNWARWHLPGNGPQPYAVYVDETDAVWVSDWGANAILRFDPKTEKFESFPLPDSYADVRQLAGRKGEIWGAESGADKLFELNSIRTTVTSLAMALIVLVGNHFILGTTPQNQSQEHLNSDLAAQPNQTESSVLRLTDAKRWQFVKALEDTALVANGGKAHCVATVLLAAGAQGLWDELEPLLTYPGWDVGGTPTTPSPPYVPPGITILSGTDKGEPFVCASALAQILQGITSIQTQVRVNQITSILSQCKNECVQIEINHENMR
jgi:hypothetical protein